MSLVDNGGLSAADIAAVMGNNGNNGFGFGGDGAWWLLVLFLFAFNGNGWGNNGMGGGMMPWMLGNQQNNDIQRGFDQQAVMAGINGINASLANAEVSRCNAQANVLQMLNTIAMNQQNCCCENRAGLADLKYTVATEACTDRASVTDGIRDIIQNQTANTQAILDKMCQQELEAERRENQNLRSQLQMRDLAASQTAQTAQLLADNARQTTALEQYLNPAPIPAYVVQNPACCNQGFYNSGCGCGNVA